MFQMHSANLLRSNKHVTASRVALKPRPVPLHNQARQPWRSVVTAPHFNASSTVISPEAPPGKVAESSWTVGSGHTASSLSAALLSDSNGSSRKDTATVCTDYGGGGGGRGGDGGGDGGEDGGSEDSDGDTPDGIMWLLLLAILGIPVCVAFLVWGGMCKLLHPCPQWQPPLPVSGTEPAFSERPWLKEQYALGSNCYSYAIGDVRTASERPSKAQPGERAQEQADASAWSSACSSLVPRVLADNPDDVYLELPALRCRPGYHKIMMFSQGEKQEDDFHFYRQHRDVKYRVRAGDSLASIAAFLGVTPAFLRKHNPRASDPPHPGTLLAPALGLWSHKLGHTAGALLADGSGKAIRDPRKACREIEDYHYKHFCGAFCVRSGAAQSGIIYNSRVEMPCRERRQKKKHKRRGSAQPRQTSVSPQPPAPASSASLS